MSTLSDQTIRAQRARRRPPLRVLLVGLLLLAADCGSDRGAELRRLVPDLPERWIEELSSADEDDWRAFGKSEGVAYLNQVILVLVEATDVSSGERFAETFGVVEPALTRVQRLRSEEFGFDRQWAIYQRLRDADPEEAARCIRENRQAYAIDRDPGLDPARKIELLEGIIASLENRQAPFSTSQLWIRVAFWMGQVGERFQQKETLQRCIARSYEEGKYRITCQALGVLGSWYEDAAETDQMMACLQEGLEVAVEHRLPEQAGRLLAFQANYYASIGQLSLARELLRRASDICDDFGGAPSELRFLGDWLEFNARLGCWDLVAADLRRADHLVDRYRRWWGGGYVPDWRARFDDFAAYVDLLNGRVDEGDRRYERSEAVMMELGQLEALARLRRRWADGLLRNDRMAQARAVLERGVRDAPDAQVEGLLTVELASLHADRDDWRECEDALDAYEAFDRTHWRDPSEGAMLSDLTRVRLADAREDWEATTDALHRALVHASDRLAGLPPTQEGNLLLSELRPLQDLTHALLRGHAEAGMAMEIEWRRTSGLLGHQKPYEKTAFASIEHIVKQARHPKGAASKAGHGAATLLELSPAVSQLVFRVEAKGTTRWLRSNGAILRQRWEITERELAEQVERVLAGVRGRPRGSASDVPDAAWVRASARLARQLLSEELIASVTSGAEPVEFLVGNDGCLRELPLEILSVHEDRYDPLLRYMDIRYLGHVSIANDTGAGTRALSRRPDAGVIVADPRIDRSYSGWGEGLPALRYGRGEGEYLHKVRPKSHYLAGDRATKPALLSIWQNAPFLYFATHVVRDPEAAYLSYLPLSSSVEDPDPRLDRIDLNDLSTTHFTADPIVVLSACSSGANYLVDGAHSPGLGESFLRAGASTVIQNLWSVEDEAASTLMRQFIDLWVGAGEEPVRALNDVRRRAATISEAVYRHPYYWGGVVATVRLDVRD